MKIRLASAAVLLSMALISACGGAAKTPASACTDMCTTSGFTGGTVDVQAKETNCFCAGGSGTVSASICSTMCSAAGKGAGQAFKSGASATAPNSCQCQ